MGSAQTSALVMRVFEVEFVSNDMTDPEMREVTAAYFQAEDGMIVFKNPVHEQVFAVPTDRLVAVTRQDNTAAVNAIADRVYRSAD